MAITHKEAAVITRMMMVNKDRVYQVRGNFDIGYVSDIIKDLGEFVIIKKGGGDQNHSHTILWEQTHDNLVKANPSFKYKTHLAKYLYKQINTVIANNTSK